MLIAKNILKRFNKRISIDNNGCWYWLKMNGERLKTYGDLYVNGKTHQAHRLAYNLFIGKIPKNLLVMHTCDTPPCVNPKHLKVGTNKDNFLDSVSKGRFYQLIKPKTKCIRGHVFRGKNIAKYRQKNGKIQIRCRKCDNNFQRKCYWRDKVRSLFKYACIVILVIFNGCVSLDYNYAHIKPKELEAWIYNNMPYKKDFHDCTEFAEFAVKALDRQGCLAKVVSDPYHGHAFVEYDCRKIGMNQGEILNIKSKGD